MRANLISAARATWSQRARIPGKKGHHALLFRLDPTRRVMRPGSHHVRGPRPRRMVRPGPDGRCGRSHQRDAPRSVRWRLGLGAMAGALVLVVSGCGSASDSSTTSNGRLPSLPPEERIAAVDYRPSGKSDLVGVRWGLAGPPTAKRIHVVASRGYCVGEAPPKFEAVRVVERGKSLYITAFGSKSTPGSAGAICRGIGGFQRGYVELRQDPSAARLYDASTSPPTLRWPIDRRD